MAPLREPRTIRDTAVVALTCLILSEGKAAPDHTLLPPWPPTYNLGKSTMVQVGAHGKDLPYNKNHSKLIAQWGILSFDWANLEDEWGLDKPTDDDQKLLDAAAAVKAAAPETKVWIYRSMVNPISTFKTIREKLEDPSYHGYFVKFAADAPPDGHMGNYYRCSSKSGKRVCSQYANRPAVPGDCGSVPCAWFLLDFRNESLKQWILDDWLMGPYGMANSSVDGFLFDDWWTVGNGPMEASGWSAATGMKPYDQALYDMTGNYTELVWEAEKRIRSKGGFVWNNLNCDQGEYPGKPIYDPTKSYDPTKKNNGMMPCGVVKTEGFFAERPKQLSEAKAKCSAWLRKACSTNSTIQSVPYLHSFTGPDSRSHAKEFPLVAPTQDVAQFLLVRGPYAWMGYGWIGAMEPWAYDRPKELDLDVGEPVDALCRETVPNESEVFVRKWSKVHVEMDCKQWKASISPTDEALII